MFTPSRIIPAISFLLFSCLLAQQSQASIVVIDDFSVLPSAGNRTAVVSPSGATVTIPDPIGGSNISAVPGTAGGGCYRVDAFTDQEGSAVTLSYDLTSALTCDTLNLPIFGGANFDINDWDLRLRADGVQLFDSALTTTIVDPSIIGATSLEFEFIYRGTAGANNELFFGQGDSSKVSTGGGTFSSSGDGAGGGGGGGAVPEPGSLAFLGMLAVGCAMTRRRH